MKTFKIYQAKRRTYIQEDNQFFCTNNDQSNFDFASISKEDLPISLELGWKEYEADTLTGAYQQHLELCKTAAIENEQHRAVVAVESQLRDMELLAKAEALIANQPIPVTVENLRIIAKYLNMSNWGGWTLPKMTIGYSANQYDCDGKTATTITLDQPITDEEAGIFNESRFVVGAPKGHLNKYQRI
jgi:hypothetical protein